MLSVALLSKWHVHWVDYMNEALANPNISIQRVWDEDAHRGEAWAADLGVAFERDLDKLLADPSIHAVIVTTPTNMHKDVIIRAANSGKHIFTEKVLALSVSDCAEIYEAVERNNVQLMISLPRLVEPYYLFAQEAVDQGILGELNTVRVRVAHDGTVRTSKNPHGWLPQHFYDPVLCGGGAFVDLGAHAIYLTNRFGGKAKTVTANFVVPKGYEVDVHAVATVEYESGAIGILETGFTSGAGMFIMELHGTKGTIVVENHKVRMRLAGSEWEEVNDLPARMLMPMEQWVMSIQGGYAPTICKEDAILLTAINEAAALSASTGGRIKLQGVSAATGKAI
ncbi:Gfo/Idh/MocA family protein [Paenibacillus xerothermodurans]|uniref:Gfo/Idh/MocA family oxidoreductase n=1 Tax=Paenibacillus xerothermodurans TaxID=1977292 RepID=A0A2W1NC30_PAEXE|nr:Gfo/Idh/MocA family oxidoreductase [Paenibacillus xerothermodurans]PZE22249.1 gfo/Idh/MocA family oxidoreductase [Paenibacillus xerothermodurans]